MMPHRRDQDFLRQVQKGGVEFTGDDVRPLHGVGDLPQQFRVALGIRGGARRRRKNGVVLARCIDETAFDGTAPGLDVRLDQLLSKHREIFRRITDGDPRLAQKRVPLGTVPRAHARDCQVHDDVIEERDDPVDGPHEAVISLAPTHGLGERDRQHGRRHPRRQNVGGRGPVHRLAHTDALPLLGGDPLQLTHGDTLRAGEPLGRPGRPARRVERRGHRRTADQGYGIGLPVAQAVRQEGETPRCPERLDVAVDAELVVRQEHASLELVEQDEAKVLQGSVDHPRRNLLGPDLKEKDSPGAGAHWPGIFEVDGGVLSSGKPMVSRVFKYPLAHPTERRLTLWMNPVLSVTLIAPRASRTLNV